MKRIFNVLLLAMLALPAFAADHEGWLTNFGEARKKAKAEQKRILMLFTGSDWCPPCMKWEKETFSTTEFRDYAKTNLVLLMVDFPNKKKLPRAQGVANNALLDEFKVEEYPTVIILDSGAKKIDQFGFIEGGPKPLLARLQK